MNPNFKVISEIGTSYKKQITVEVTDMTIDWLLENFSNDVENVCPYLCGFMSNVIEGSRRRGDKKLTFQLTDNHIHVENDGEVSSAGMNYHLMMGLGLSKKAMAGIRAVMRGVFSVRFENGCKAPKNGSESFGIITLMHYIQHGGSEVARSATRQLYEQLCKIPFSENHGILQRELILKTIKDTNPYFIFPKLTFTYVVQK